MKPRVTDADSTIVIQSDSVLIDSCPPLCAIREVAGPAEEQSPHITIHSCVMQGVKTYCMAQSE